MHQFYFLLTLRSVGVLRGLDRRWVWYCHAKVGLLQYMEGVLENHAERTNLCLFSHLGCIYGGI